MAMTKEEWLEWKHHPLTVKYHRYLLDYRQKLMENWAAGSYSQGTMEQMSLLNLQAMSKALLLQDLAELDDDFVSEFYRQERKGSDDAGEDQGQG